MTGALVDFQQLNEFSHVVLIYFKIFIPLVISPERAMSAMVSGNKTVMFDLILFNFITVSRRGG